MNIYDLLNKRFCNHKEIEYWQWLFSDDEIYRLEEREQNQAKAVQKLLLFKFDDNLKNPIVIGIGEFEEKHLKELDYAKLPYVVQAKLGEYFWKIKKEYNFAKKAVEAYQKRYFEVFDLDDWVDCAEAIDRMLEISFQINEPELKDQAAKLLHDEIIRINGSDEKFFSISLLKKAINQKIGNSCEYLDIVDRIITASRQNPYDTRKLECSYEIKAKLLRLCKGKGSNNEIKECQKEHATVLVELSDKVNSNDFRGVSIKVDLLEKAVQLLNEAGNHQEANDIYKKALICRKKLPETMQSIKMPLSISKEDYQHLVTEFENLTPREAVIKLAFGAKIYQKEDIKQEILGSKDISLRFFKTTSIDDDGNAIVEIPGLNTTDIDNNTEVLEMHMHRLIREKAELNGIVLYPAFNKVIEQYDISEDVIDFIFDGNAIVPDYMVGTIKNALYLAFHHKTTEAVIILSTQMENVFREIARSAGAVIYTLKPDHTSMAKVLKSVFDLPELKECYDEDLLFLFKSLLNEKAGANIRNMAAHGLIKQNYGNTGLGIYFILITLQLLIISSRAYASTVRDFKKTD